MDFDDTEMNFDNTEMNFDNTEMDFDNSGIKSDGVGMKVTNKKFNDEWFRKYFSTNCKDTPLTSFT